MHRCSSSSVRLVNATAPTPLLGIWQNVTAMLDLMPICIKAGSCWYMFLSKVLASLNFGEIYCFYLCVKRVEREKDKSVMYTLSSIHISSFMYLASNLSNVIT